MWPSLGETNIKYTKEGNINKYSSESCNMVYYFFKKCILLMYVREMFLSF